MIDLQLTDPDRDLFGRVVARYGATALSQLLTSPGDVPRPVRRRPPASQQQCGQVYVTPVSHLRMPAIITLLLDCWRNRTPKGGTDEVFHIAVVQDRELASELQPYELFHAFTTGEEDKHGQIEIFTY